MMNPTRPIRTEATPAESAGIRPWVVYGLGVAFIVLLFVCYVQADVALIWMESIIRWLFMG